MTLLYDELVDQPNISDDDVVCRRVGWVDLGGASKFSPGATPELIGNAFQDSSADKAAALGYPRACMSVALLSALVSNGQAPEIELVEHPDCGLAAVRVGDLRALKRKSGEPCPQGVMLAPREVTAWHAVVFTMDCTRRSAGVKEAIARVASWYVPLVR